MPFRGDYYTLTPDARPLVRGLIYPVPDPRFPFLGIHLTKRIDGNVLAGPNAVLATAREGYRRRDLSLRDLAEHAGLSRASCGWLGSTGAWAPPSCGATGRKRAFLADLQRYVPELPREQLVFGPSGVRAQALARDGSTGRRLPAGRLRPRAPRAQRALACRDLVAGHRARAGREAIDRFGL